jgi:hypothetical protein
MESVATTLRIHPYSRQGTLAKLDQRTKEARLIREARAELLVHVGGKPSATQRALIEQLLQIKLRLAVMDRKFAKTGAQTDHDSRTYLAWANSYARLLRQLGLNGVPAERSPSLSEIVASAAATKPTRAPHVMPAAITPAAADAPSGALPGGSA